MEYNQSEFLLSLSDMKTSELTKLLRQTIDESINIFSQLYLNDVDQLEERTNLYNKSGYHQQTRIGMLVELLSIKETNETKRLMYEDCIKSTISLPGFVYNDSGDVEYQYLKLIQNRIPIVKDKVDIENKLSDSDKKNELLQEYVSLTSKISEFEKRKLLNIYNHRVNWVISLLIKLKTKLNKGLTEKAIY